jgi:hypothetical protein
MAAAEPRYWNRASKQMETTRQMRAYRRPPGL